MKLLNQELLTFDEAAKVFPGNPHKNSLRRWADAGIDGVVLKSWRSGRVRVTSKEAIEEFILARSRQFQRPLRQEAADTEAKLDTLGVK